MKKPVFIKLIVVFVLCALVFAMAQMYAVQSSAIPRFHSEQELHFFKTKLASPIGVGDYFLTAKHCESCHGYDSTHYASVDSNGVDINLHDDWKATMMANAAKDPFWRAKVSHEILVNPGHTLELQNNCTSCHAPMGNYTNKLKGLSSHYTIANLLTDSLGLDGVSCVSCHAIGDSLALGRSFSGYLPYDTSRIIYGPYTFPMSGPMLLGSGYEPVYSAHMNQAKTCSPCHTLINKSVDLNGNYTGNSFVEQATYQEWLNSTYSITTTTCQKCHMPQINSGVVIANDNFGALPRAPFSQHIFAGANSLMLALMKQNKSRLAIDVADRLFDSTLQATTNLLRYQTLQLSVQADSITSDTAFFSANLLNLAGHKFPSGYPSRRAVMQFFVLDANQDTIFQTGIFNPDYRLRGESLTFDQHRNVIRQSHQNQIYEMVMGDVTQQVTTVAERAAFLLKDNRLPPKGFTTQHNAYDTAKISADALFDADFNKIAGTEGSGQDIVHFHVPVSGLSGNVRVYAKVYYQSIPPKWLDEIFASSTAEIDSFKVMFNKCDQKPVLIAADSIISIALHAGKKKKQELDLQVWPSFSNGNVFVRCGGNVQIEAYSIYSLAGALMQREILSQPESILNLQLPDQSGVYLIGIQLKGRVIYRKVYRN